MMVINIEIQGEAPFDCNGNLSALPPHSKKWHQSFQYFLVAKGVVNDAQKKALLPHSTRMEVLVSYDMLTDPEREMDTEFEKTLHTLNAYFATKLNKPSERRVQECGLAGWQDSQSIYCQTLETATELLFY